MSIHLMFVEIYLPGLIARMKHELVCIFSFCPGSSSSCPEPHTLQSSQERSPFWPSKKVSGEEATAGYYTTNSYQYQDTEL